MREFSLSATGPDFRSLFMALPKPCLILAADAPRFTVIEANDAYLRASLIERDRLVGHGIFEAFPDRLDELGGAGVRNLRASLDQVLVSRLSDAMAAQPCSVRRPDGSVEERHWSVVNTPVFDERGRVAAIIHQIEDMTDQVRLRRANDALQESEARFRTAIDSSPALIWIADADGETIFANQRHQSFFGVDSETMLRERWRSIVHPEDVNAFHDAFRVALAARAPFQRPVRVNHPTLGLRWLSCDAAPRWSADGRFLGYVGINIDVTEAVTAETALRESDERYRSLFNSIDAGFCIVEVKFDEEGDAADYRFVEVNPAFEQQTGLKGAVGRWMRELAPAHEQHWFDIYGRIALTGIPARFESPAQALGDRWYDVHAFRIGDPDAHRVAVLFNDITERRRAEETLRVSEERLRLATEGAGMGTWDFELRTRSGIWSDSSFKLMGYEPTPDRSWTFEMWTNCVHPDDLPRARAAAAQAKIGHQSYSVEYRIKRANDGRERWVQAFGHYIYDDADEPVRYVGVFFDVTERKRAEEALRVLNETLEARVASAIAEREQAEEALRQAQKMEAMGQLTGGVAHDFNNLLTPIVGSLDMLQRRGGGDERTQRLIDGALQSAERAKTLVQRLLAFARRQPLQPTAVDVAKLVEGMADLIGSTSGPQVKVAVDIAARLPAAKADPNQLEMALLNLAVNARDAMPDGGTLTIAAAHEVIGSNHRSKLKPGRYVRLSVADTGVGMDDATLKRAVEPFFSTKGIGKGTGLGLSMVHGLAAQLGGGLALQSRPGVGTSVELWLPVSDDVIEAGEQIAEADVLSATGTALLVDDEELVRASTADMLADLGYAVLEANSAEDALKLIDDALDIDLLVTDHLMPRMSGTSLARAALDRRPNLPVLIVSGYAEVEGIAPDLPRLTKPFRQADLAAAIAELSSTTGRVG